MNQSIIKQLFCALIILTMLSGCSGSATAQLPTRAPTTAPALPTATSIVFPSPTTALALPTATSIVLPSPTTLSTSNPAPMTPLYWPTQNWQSSTPEKQGMESAQILKVFDFIQNSNQNLHSVVIIRNGYVVTEAYYPPFRPDARHNTNSTTISVVSILIGIAIQEGYIKGVDQKMLDFFPDYKIANLNAQKQAITIKDLLTNTSGLNEDDSGKDASDNWVQFVLNLPMDNDPGRLQNMNGGGYHLLSAIIQKTTGMSALAFANKVLFGPLGISGAGWLTDPQGINNGSGLLYLTSRDMAKIGYLYLNNGEWDGKQIVPKEYVLASTRHLFDINHSTIGWGYGYGWLIAPDGSFLAEGSYGQVIYVKPAQGMVTVFTGATADDFTPNVENLVDQYIVPAVKSPGPLPENPASLALLNHKITSLEKPAPKPIPPLPGIGQTISGKKYLVDDGEAFTLTFAGDKATLDWSYKGQSTQFPIGLDNVYRITPFAQTDMTSLLGATEQRLGDVFIALLGSWKSADTFELTIQSLDSIRHHIVDFKFAGDKVNIQNSNIVDNEVVTLQGQAQSK